MVIGFSYCLETAATYTTQGDDTMMVVQMVATLCALQTQFLGYNSSCGVANLNELIHLRNNYIGAGIVEWLVKRSPFQISCGSYKVFLESTSNIFGLILSIALELEQMKGVGVLCSGNATSNEGVNKSPDMVQGQGKIRVQTYQEARTKNQRAFFGGTWSDSVEHEEEKTKDETCLVAQASNEICLGINLEPDEWIKDSGCSKHMTGNRKLFSTYKAYNGVDEVLDGAFGGVGDEEVVVGEGVVVTSSSLEMLTNNCLGGMMVSLIFLEGLEEEALCEFHGRMGLRKMKMVEEWEVRFIYFERIRSSRKA
ncbi:hypothetical protein Tco_1311451 [Tanacetum coccineum]